MRFDSCVGWWWKKIVIFLLLLLLVRLVICLGRLLGWRQPSLAGPRGCSRVYPEPWSLLASISDAPQKTLGSFGGYGLHSSVLHHMYTFQSFQPGMSCTCGGPVGCGQSSAERLSPALFVPAYDNGQRGWIFKVKVFFWKNELWMYFVSFVACDWAPNYLVNMQLDTREKT